MVLITGEGDKYTPSYDAFLAFATANTKDALRFVHVYSNYQPVFVHTLLTDDEKFWGKSAVSGRPLPQPRGASLPSFGWFEKPTSVPLLWVGRGLCPLCGVSHPKGSVLSGAWPIQDSQQPPSLGLRSDPVPVLLEAAGACVRASVGAGSPTLWRKDKGEEAVGILWKASSWADPPPPVEPLRQ